MVSGRGFGSGCVTVEMVGKPYSPVEQEDVSKVVAGMVGGGGRTERQAFI